MKRKKLILISIMFFVSSLGNFKTNHFCNRNNCITNDLIQNKVEKKKVNSKINLYNVPKNIVKNDDDDKDNTQGLFSKEIFFAEVWVAAAIFTTILFSIIGFFIGVISKKISEMSKSLSKTFDDAYFSEIDEHLPLISNKNINSNTLTSPIQDDIAINNNENESSESVITPKSGFWAGATTGMIGSIFVGFVGFVAYNLNIKYSNENDY